MADLEFKARKIVGGHVTGEALVSQEPVCFLGGVDVKTGLFTERRHPLEGKCIAGKVLIFPIGKGSTGGSYLLYEATLNGVAPAAFINLKADPVTVVGCIISELPMMDQVQGDILSQVHDGDIVDVDADAGVIRVTRKGEA